MKKYRIVLQEIGGSTFKTGRLCLHVSAIRMQGWWATVSEVSARMEEKWNNFRRTISSNRETSRSLPLSPKVLYALLTILAHFA